MAGLLKTLARQLFGSTTPATPVKRVVKTEYRPTTRASYVAPTVGPEENIKIVVDMPVVAQQKVKPIEEPTVKWNGSAQVTLEENEVENMTKGNVNIEPNDDYLLSQIDEFREKAQQLQNLLLSKESKVMELQNIVDEREGKAKELETILSERQKAADGIAEEMAKEVSAEINSQIDVVIGKVTAKLDELGVTIGKDLENGQNLTKEQYEELKNTLDAVLPELKEQLDTLKGDLSEKVHSENVKCYRNVSDLIKSVEDKMDALKNTEQNVEKKAGAIHKCTIVLIVLTILNLLGVVAVALLQLGVLR